MGEGVPDQEETEGKSWGGRSVRSTIASAASLGLASLPWYGWPLQTLAGMEREFQKFCW